MSGKSWTQSDPSCSQKVVFHIEDINGEYEDKNQKIFTSYSMAKSLEKKKNKINNFKYSWDITKKYVNPYEYIHTIIPGKNISVGKYRPISRSYFKFIEIYYSFDLGNLFNNES